MQVRMQGIPWWSALMQERVDCGVILQTVVEAGVAVGCGSRHPLPEETSVHYSLDANRVHNSGFHGDVIAGSMVIDRLC